MSVLTQDELRSIAARVQEHLDAHRARSGVSLIVPEGGLREDDGWGPSSWRRINPAFVVSTICVS